MVIAAFNLSQTKKQTSNLLLLISKSETVPVPNDILLNYL